MSFMDGPLLHVARKTNGFDLRGDLSLGDGQGVLKMVAVTYSKKASNWRRDKELCSVSKGLILGIPTDKTETKLKEQIQRKPTTLCTWHNAMGDFEAFFSNTQISFDQIIQKKNWGIQKIFLSRPTIEPCLQRFFFIYCKFWCLFFVSYPWPWKSFKIWVYISSVRHNWDL